MVRYTILFLILFFTFTPKVNAIDDTMTTTAASVVDTAGNQDGTQEIIPDLLGNDDWLDEETADESSVKESVIYDPLESINRISFGFNNTLYDWILKPVTDGYSWLLPYEVRGSIGNVFDNLGAPVRLVNATLQGDLERTEIIFERFFINSILGIFGLHDVADDNFHLKKQKADFGQTLGTWGVGFGPYLCWPLLGSSSVRDSIGLGVDTHFNMVGYLIDDWELQLSYSGLKMTNTLSLHSGMIEDLRRVSLDPYVAARQAYFDYRSNLIKRAVPVEEKQIIEQRHVVETIE